MEKKDAVMLCGVVMCVCVWVCCCCADWLRTPRCFWRQASLLLLEWPSINSRSLPSKSLRRKSDSGWLAGFRFALLRRAPPSPAAPLTLNLSPLTTHHSTQTLDYRSTTVPPPVPPVARWSLPKNTPRDLSRACRRKSLHELLISSVAL